VVEADRVGGAVAAGPAVGEGEIHVAVAVEVGRRHTAAVEAAGEFRAGEGAGAIVEADAAEAAEAAPRDDGDRNVVVPVAVEVRRGDAVVSPAVDVVGEEV